MAINYDYKILTQPSDIIAWFELRKPIAVLAHDVCKDPFKIANNLIYIAIAYNDGMD